MRTVVDIHCHTFNGDDLPVRGFVRNVHMEGKPYGDALASLVDALVQKKAPGYEDELRRLDSLLAQVLAMPVPVAANESLDGAEPLVADSVVPELDAVVEAELHELAATNPYLLEAAAVAVKETAGDTLRTDESIGDWGPAAVRGTRWAAIYASSRLDNTVHLVRQFKDSVDLFTPMLVDLEFGLNDRAKTTVMQQVELQERISRLSMLGGLPGVKRARVHPFVGFDPRREVLSAKCGDPIGALDTIKLAVERYGFVGVKLYPPMGFRPLNNETKNDGPPGQDGAAVDAVLRKLYEWCLAEDVPVTAHCNISNGAREAYDEFSDPDDWKTVLEQFPGLHLNLGHFGGMRALDEGTWPRKIAALATEPSPKTEQAQNPPLTTGQSLHADVANHRNDQPEFTMYMTQLRDLFDAPETGTMAGRLMYGTDWYMLAILPNLDTFMDTYRTAYQDTFPKETFPGAVDAFFGDRALSFLGFDDAQNRNCVRLRTRYEKYAPMRMPSWLSS